MEKNKTMNHLSRNLTTLMNGRKLKATELSSLVGGVISQKTINNIQAGRGSTTLEKLDILADYFKIDSAVLISRDHSLTTETLLLIKLFNQSDEYSKKTILKIATLESERNK